LLGNVAEIWGTLRSDPRFADTRIAIASCCDEPEWARELLTKFRISESETMAQSVSFVQIHYGRKTEHLRQIAKESGVPLAEMCFFDDQSGHVRDAGGLGVTAVQTPSGGVSWKHFNNALEEYASRHEQLEETFGSS